MTVQEYIEARKLLLAGVEPHRTVCLACFQPGGFCYCPFVQRFNPQIKFVILTHPIEARRRLATGRMASLALEDSEFIVGIDYSQDSQVRAITQSAEYQCVVLSPKGDSLNLSQLDANKRDCLIDRHKKLVVFVIDGTWHTANKMMRISDPINRLPRICFAPRVSSRFRVRKQPRQHFVSTIEAIHQTIDLLGSAAGFDVSSRLHDSLFVPLDQLVNQQIECTQRLRRIGQNRVRKVLKKLAR